jgi:predicted GNAT family acetyltransferase
VTPVHPLDHVIWSALTSHHATFAEGGELAKRYPSAVAAFAAVREPTPAAFRELATLVTPADPVALFTVEPAETDVLTAVQRLAVDQMVAGPLARPRAPEQLVALGEADVPEMRALIELTQPGPFGPRTIDMGRYFGLRRDGRLVAIAGERMHLHGYTELSAVCVHPDHLRRGHAAELMLHVAQGIVARGETPMLHVKASNASAIALYHKLGFTRRRTVHLAVFASHPGTERVHP